MSYLTPFVTKPRAVSMVHTNTSNSRNSGDRVDYSSQVFMKTCQHRSATTSAPVYPSAPNMNGRSMSEHAYYSQLRGSNGTDCGDGNETGDDSDCFHESTPAWKKTQHAVPRIRVVGFHVSSPYTKSGGSGTSRSHEQGQASRESATVRSGSSRQPAVSTRSDIVCRESTYSAIDKPHSSRSPASIPHHRNDTRNATFAHGSERRKILTSGN